jgi:hypothetical protein
MAVPGFRPEALDEAGGPLWIDSLANEDPNHLLHVVRGLSPVAAIELVGGRVVRELTPGELPMERPDEWSTPAHAAMSADRMIDLLVAGRRGDWTFVYDASGVTGWTKDFKAMATLLSADGRVAATSNWTINAATGISYAEDGQLVFAVTDSYNPEYHDADTPDQLRPVIEDAGRVEDAEDGDDYEINMRIVCVLAGLTWTPDELRAEPLLIGEVSESSFYDVVAKMSQAGPSAPPWRDPRAPNG